MTMREIPSSHAKRVIDRDNRVAPAYVVGTFSRLEPFGPSKKENSNPNTLAHAAIADRLISERMALVSQDYDNPNPNDDQAINQLRGLKDDIIHAKRSGKEAAIERINKLRKDYFARVYPDVKPEARDARWTNAEFEAVNRFEATDPSLQELHKFIQGIDGQEAARVQAAEAKKAEDKRLADEAKANAGTTVPVEPTPTLTADTSISEEPEGPTAPNEAPARRLAAKPIKEMNLQELQAAYAQIRANWPTEQLSQFDADLNKEFIAKLPKMNTREFRNLKNKPLERDRMNLAIARELLDKKNQSAVAEIDLEKMNLNQLKTAYDQITYHLSYKDLSKLNIDYEDFLAKMTPGQQENFHRDPLEQNRMKLLIARKFLEESVAGTQSPKLLAPPVAVKRNLLDNVKRGFNGVKKFVGEIISNFKKGFKQGWEKAYGRGKKNQLT